LISHGDGRYHRAWRGCEDNDLVGVFEGHEYPARAGVVDDLMGLSANGYRTNDIISGVGDDGDRGGVLLLDFTDLIWESMRASPTP
jgi:hypothetical protein